MRGAISCELAARAFSSRDASHGFGYDMAEFASAVVGLVAAGAEAGSALYSLISTLKDAPTEFLALYDEVTDFRAILARLVEAAESGDIDAGGTAALRPRADDIVTEIENLLAKVQKVGSGGRDGAGGRVDRIRWLRRARKAKKLEERLGALKGSICNLIALGMLFVAPLLVSEQSL